MKSNNEIRDLAIMFEKKKRELKEKQDEFDAIKKEFEENIERYFQSGSSNFSKVVFHYDGGEFASNKEIIVNRHQRSSVIFDADKLEEVIGKDLSKSVILKRYEIIDIKNFIKYLKSFGIDKNKFKSFLHVSKNVDCNELNRLSEIGEIEKEKLDGCYKVNVSKPYFTVKIEEV